MDKKDRKTFLKRIAFVGSYPPRPCGLATFTTDLCNVLIEEFPLLECMAAAVDDGMEKYDYPERVRSVIYEQDLNSYRQVAEFLNENKIECVCLQHEFGLFGGTAGSYILELLKHLRMPVVSVLHTILRNPQLEQKRVVERMAIHSNKLVTLSYKGAQFLEEIYGIPRSKITVIPHGIPDISPINSDHYKSKYNLQGKTVLLTFGLLSRGKGVENVITAMPSIVKQHPEVVYIILGMTHPKLKAQEGESYRESLQKLAQECGVYQNIIFDNRFVALDELKEFIGLTDIYITPYLNEEQITSGTLSYAVGAGKPVISTPYWHAQELLQEGRGRLVPFRSPESIAQAVCEILTNKEYRDTICKKAYLFGRNMIWPTVAQNYMDCFEKTRHEKQVFQISFSNTSLQNPLSITELPDLKLNHFYRMTDQTGLFQHAIITCPNRHEGYCTDDNARAYLLTLFLQQIERKHTSVVSKLAEIYIAFLWHAFNSANGRFRNQLNFDKKWLEEQGSEDSHGRALWACAAGFIRSQQAGHTTLCRLLFEKALPAVYEFTSPRAWAFVLLALHEYGKRLGTDHTVYELREKLAEQLLYNYRKYHTKEWNWFEPILAYDNAVLSHALILTGTDLNDASMRDVGLETLEWVYDLQISSSLNCFSPIGNNGFYPQNGKRAYYDQQPLEAHSMILACLDTYRTTGRLIWKERAQKIFQWFMGYNDEGLSLYNPETGGCRDGLQPGKVNQNEGAESTLAFWISWAKLKKTLQTFQQHQESSQERCLERSIRLN